MCRLAVVLLATSAVMQGSPPVKHEIVHGLRDPMELAVAPDGQLYVVEREGRMLRINPDTGGIFEIGKLDVECRVAADPKSKHAPEDGLLGIALDPHFSENQRIFVYHSLREPWLNRLSRFTLKDGKVDLSSEVTILEIPTEREHYASHQAGSLEFGPDGLLYLSTGDNTNPFESNGHAPIDDRDERTRWDAQRSAGNTNDLRGKILRIRPTESGYEIPEGNLFPPDTAKTRPEIFIMGCRNPFRISVDPRSGTLYWGEVGPDARKDTDFGPMGYDEVNQAKTAGNYGWPFVIADNKPYPIRDFAGRSIKATTDPASPLNPGQRNTGLRTLPPAQPAFIWYPYSDSETFPVMGKGGRNSMAGPAFYYDASRRFNILGKEEDRSLFTYDWMRGAIYQVKLDDEEKLERLEAFMEGLVHPIDLEMDHDGSLLILEYGSAWYFNENGSISRLVPDEGNQPPTISIQPREEPGTFAVDQVSDPEGKEMTVHWYASSGVSETKIGEGTTVSLPGGDFSDVRAVAIDDKGARGFARIDLKELGNRGELALTIIEPKKARGFGETAGFKIEAETPPDASKTRIRVRYIAPSGHDSEGVDLPEAIEQAVRANQCLACHQVEASSVGPSYLDVALRYQTRSDAADYLQKKLKTGGAGVWGEVPMPPQAALSDADSARIVEAILGLSTGLTEQAGALEGEIPLPRKFGAEPGGAWEFIAESENYSPARVRIPAK